MSRRCSHCGHNGHNSRTCLDKGFKLFGVRLTEPSSSSAVVSSALMRKSVSMGNLSSYGSSEAASSSSASPLEPPDLGDSLDGYASDDLVHTNSSARERKKGVPWTEEEHKLFLLGLQRLGKGDWRGISRNFVKTRTPTQVASHAQKYFLRRSNLNKRRRRSSLFDITPETVSSLPEDSVLEEQGFERELSLGQNIPFGDGEAPLLSRHAYPSGGFPVSLSSISLSGMPMSVPEITEEASEAGDTEDLESGEMAEEAFLQPSAAIPGMGSVPKGDTDAGGEPSRLCLPYPLFPMWSGPCLQMAENQGSWSSESKIVKPTPIIPTPPVNIDDSMRISELSLSSTRPVMEPTALSYKLLEEGSRHSAFHTMPSVGTGELDTQGSLSNAISVP